MFSTNFDPGQQRSLSRRQLLRRATAMTVTGLAAAAAAQHLVASGARASSPTAAASRDAQRVLTPPRIGWSCPIEKLAGRLARFPDATYIRLFRPAGQGLPAWSELNLIPGDVTVHLSVKDRGLPVGSWLSSRPARWTSPLVFTIDHEPEQQQNGDPSPAVFYEEWGELTAGLAGHPQRASIVLTPTFTRFAAEIAPDRGTWYQNFGRVVELPGVDAVGFDVYNPGAEYQTSAQMFAWVVAFAGERGLPLYIAEWGRKRMATDDGTVCAQHMHDDVAYLRTRGVAGVAWFYTGKDNLDTGQDGQPRKPERRALAKLIAAG